MIEHAPPPVARPRRPAGARLRLSLLVAGVVVMLGGCTIVRDALDPTLRAERALASYRSQAQQQRLQWADDGFYIGVRLVPLLLITGAGVVGVLVLYRRLAAPDTTVLHYEVKRLAAIHQPGQTPQTLSYSYQPRLAYRDAAAPAVASTAPELLLPAADVPSAADLLRQGRIGRGNPLILGYEAGRELSGSWNDLYATITAGLPGTGKTTTQRFFAIQTALHGAKFAIADPHAGAADDSLAATLDPLRDLFLCEPASEPRAILELVRYVAAIGEARIKGQSDDRTPIILWVDELTGLLGRSDIGPQLAGLLEQIAQEYRKRAVYLSASGQIWTAARTTSELRDSFASVLCHRMKRSQARLILPTDEAQQVERLAAGQAVLWRTSGQTSIVTIPNTTAADVAQAAIQLAYARHTDGIPAAVFTPHASGRVEPALRQAYASDEPAANVTPRREPASAEALRAAALFMGGMTPAQIVRELRGVPTNRGAAYQKALDEVLRLVREGLHAGTP